jgi:hypothetical protein
MPIKRRAQLIWPQASLIFDCRRLAVPTGTPFIVGTLSVPVALVKESLNSPSPKQTLHRSRGGQTVTMPPQLVRTL